MPRDRHARNPSPSSSLTYSRSPSPMYPRSRSRSRTRSTRKGSFTRDNSFTSPSPADTEHQQRARSISSSVSSSRSSSRASLRNDRKGPSNDKTKSDSGLQTSLAFLGAVGAATYAAHKLWPKGITYGEKEAWEIKEDVKHAGRAAKRAVAGQSPPRRGPYRKQADHRIPEDRRLRDEGRLGPRGRRLEVEDIARRPGHRREIEQIEIIRRPLNAARGYTDRASIASPASGNRAGDVRRDRYIEERRTGRPQNVSRGHTDGPSAASVASGSIASDMRRDMYIEDNRTERPANVPGGRTNGYSVAATSGDKSEDVRRERYVQAERSERSSYYDHGERGGGRREDGTPRYVEREVTHEESRPYGMGYVHEEALAFDRRGRR